MMMITKLYSIETLLIKKQITFDLKIYFTGLCQRVYFIFEQLHIHIFG